MKESFLRNLVLLPEEQKIEMYRNSNQDPYGVHDLVTYAGVDNRKSIWRAIRRGDVSVDGTVYPKRPHNNKKASSKRKNRGMTTTEMRRRVYEQQRQYRDY